MCNLNRLFVILGVGGFVCFLWLVFEGIHRLVCKGESDEDGDET